VPNSGRVFYNFSGLKGQSKVTRDGLFYDSTKVTFVLSAIDPNFIDDFVELLFQYDQIYLGTLLLRPFQVLKEEVYHFEETTKFVCLSPLVVISEGLPQIEIKKFILPTENTFSDLLYESTMNRMEQSGFFNLEELRTFSNFYFEAESDYIEKSKLSEKKYSRIYHSRHKGSEIEVRGYTLPFLLHAHPKVQEFVFHAGLGEETEEGFGMIDLADRAHSTKIIPYEWPNSGAQAEGIF
jgi:CRISPR-associated endoribonuclease Cas6